MANNGPQDSQYGNLAGEAAGGVIGASIGGSAGAALGAGLGGSAGGIIGGLFGGTTGGYTLPWDQYNARLSQIASYSNQLSGATSQYATAIGNMYQTAFNQYLPNAAAAFAGRGLNVDSGAFGAELGRTAATLTSEDLTQVAKQNISNINDVNSAYGNAWSAMFGAADRSNAAGFTQNNENAAGLGALSGQLINTGFKAMQDKPVQNPWSTDYSSPVVSSDYSYGKYSPNLGANGTPPNPFDLALMGTPGDR